MVAEDIMRTMEDGGVPKLHAKLAGRGGLGFRQPFWKSQSYSGKGKKEHSIEKDLYK